MEEIALYYPHIIPPLSWIKQSLLMFDRISTIVPMDYEFGLIPSQMVNDQESTTLRWLEDRGDWIPASTEYLDYQDYFDDLSRTIEALPRPNSKHVKKYDLSPSFLVGGKLTEKFQRLLVRRGIASVQGPRLLMPTYALHAIQAVIARHAAFYADHVFGFRGSPRRITTSTDQPQYAQFAYEPIGRTRRLLSRTRSRDWPGSTRLNPSARMGRAQSRADCYQILLNGLLPSPGPGVSLDDVIFFRNTYHDELLDFVSP